MSLDSLNEKERREREMTAKKPHWSVSLVKLDACKEAADWARTQPSYETAWKKCRRGDWMLWLLARRNADRKMLVLSACGCARLALKYVPKGEDRPRLCIETAERWALGDATIEEVKAARRAALAAADIAAAYAAYAANAAAYAATYAATYAEYAATYADAANAAAARLNTLSNCATIVRKHFPEAP